MSALWRCFQSLLRPCFLPSGGGGPARVAGKPFFDFVEVELLAPQHAREGLALHAALVFGHVVRSELRLVERVGLRLPQGEHVLGIGERLGGQLGAQPQHHAARLTRL